MGGQVTYNSDLGVCIIRVFSGFVAGDRVHTKALYIATQ